MKPLRSILLVPGLLLILLLLPLLLLPLKSFAEPSINANTAPAHRPVIGLVLSGGGARGLAHVGVLKVLEEMQIPVDIVVGTSAGSAVAALYAMGLPVDIIEDRFHKMDWARGFLDELSRDARSFRRKQEDLSFSIDGSLGIDSSGVRLKQSLIQGQQLRLVLQDLLWEGSNIRSYDDLPRRYRALATDLETGQAVVLDRGPLSEVIRASMTIPAIYPPVKLGDRLLVDGGMANNIPISVARELGADIVIAVDISTPLATRDSLDSVVTIVDQLTNFLTRSNADKQIASLGERDVFIAPDLGDVTSSDFARSDEIVEIGATAARNAAIQLHSLSLSRTDWKAYLHEKQIPHDMTVRTVNRIRIINNTDINTEVIRQRLRVKRGDVFNREKLEADLSVIYGLGYFESVSYQLLEEAGGQTLEVKAEKRSWGRNYLRFSFDYEDDFNLDSILNVAVLFNMTELNRYGAELSSAFQIGSEPYLVTNFYQPLATNDAQYVSAGMSVAKEHFNLFYEDDLITQYKVVPLQIHGDVGQEIGNNLQLQASLIREKASLEAEVGVGSGESQTINHGYSRLSLRYDDLDSSHIPKSGTYIDTDMEVYKPQLGDDSDFTLFHFDGRRAFSYRRLVINTILRAQFAPDDEASVTRLASLGGFENLSGYNRNRFVGQDMLLLGVEVYRQYKTSVIDYYLGGAYEIGQVWDSAVGNDMGGFKDSVSLILAADTFVGPVRFAASYADQDNSAFYFTIGKFIKP